MAAFHLGSPGCCCTPTGPPWDCRTPCGIDLGASIPGIAGFPYPPLRLNCGGTDLHVPFTLTPRHKTVTVAGVDYLVPFWNSGILAAPPCCTACHDAAANIRLEDAGLVSPYCWFDVTLMGCWTPITPFTYTVFTGSGPITVTTGVVRGRPTPFGAPALAYPFGVAYGISYTSSAGDNPRGATFTSGGDDPKLFCQQTGRGSGGNDFFSFDLNFIGLTPP